MSSEKLYQSVKSGKVKMEDLNEEGKNALRSYMGISTTTPKRSGTIDTNIGRKKIEAPKLLKSKVTDYARETSVTPSDKSLLQKTKGVLKTIDKNVHGAVDAFGNALTLGIANKVNEKIGVSNEAQDSVGGTVGKIGGEIAGVSKVYSLAKPLLKKASGKVASKYGKAAIEGSIAGSAFGTAKELADVAIDTRNNGDESLLKRAGNVAIEAGLFGAGDVAGTALVKGVQKAAPYIKEKSGKLLGSLKNKLNEVPESGINPFAKKTDQYKNPMDTRSHIVSKTNKDPISLLNASNEAYIKGVDSLQRINQVDKYVESVTGKKLSPKDRTYMLALNSKGSDMIARTNLIENLVDSQGNVIGDSLKAISSKIPKGRTVDFEDYLIAQHAVTRMTRGEKVYPKKMNMTPEKAEALAREYEAKFPEFKQLATEFREYSDKLTRAWLVDTGVVPESMYKAWKESNPFWVSNQRKFSDIEKVSGGKAKGGLANQTNPVKAYGQGGSERPIISPFESTIENTEKFVKTAKRNEVMQSLYRNVNDNPEAFKEFIEIVGQPNKVDDITKGDLDIDDIINRFSDEFEAAISKPDLTKGNIVRVMVDGNPVHMKIHDPQLLDALTSLAPQAQNVVVETVRNITNLMKVLTTGANPLFALTRNAFRDVPMAFISSKTTNNVAQFSYDILEGFVSSLGNGKLYKSYKALGGGHSSSVAADRNLLKQSKGQITPQNNVKGFASRALGAIENFNNALESAPRLGEFKRTLKKGGSDYDSKIKGLYEGNDITVNFKRAGNAARQVDAFLPYFNAAIQGIDKVARVFKDNPVQASVKAASAITIPTIVLYAINHDNPNYQKLSQYNKDNFYNIPIPSGKFIKIPKPHTIGVAFGSGIERILSQWMDEDPQGFYDFSNTVTNQFLPPGIGGAVQGTIDGGLMSGMGGVLQDTTAGPVIDSIANKTFTGAPIVPGYLEKVSPRYQYDSKTSELSKFIGDKTNQSPMKLDHLIKSYTGILGQLGIPSTTQGGSVKDTLVKQVTNDPVFSNDIMRKFYDMKDKVDTANADFKQTDIQSKDFDEGKRKVFNMFSDHIGDIRKVMRLVEQNEDYTRQEKKDHIKELHIQMTELAQRAIESTK